MANVANDLARYFFTEIEREIVEAEGCWNLGEVEYATHLRNVRELLRRFEELFRG